MFFAKIARLSVLFLLLCVGQVWAKPADFYQAEVTVASQGPSERSRAAAVGLERVLVRLSGSRNVAESPVVQSALSRATRYVEQYHYKQGRDELGAPRELITMTFSPRVVEDLLREAGLPYWPINRPQVILWLVEDTEAGGRQLVNDRSNPLLAALFKSASSRGLPLRLPLLDMEDQLALSSEQAWSLDEDAVLRASDRYGSDVVLIGRYTRDSTGTWLMTWQYYLNGQWHIHDQRAEDVSALADAVVNPLADQLASLYAVAPGGESAGAMVAQVAGITSFKDFRAALDYIGGLALVDDYRLQSQAGDSLLLEIVLNGDVKQLQNALSLDGKLYLDSGVQAPLGPVLTAPTVEAATRNILRLRWAGGAG